MSRINLAPNKQLDDQKYSYKTDNLEVFTYTPQRGFFSPNGFRINNDGTRDAQLIRDTPFRDAENLKVAATIDREAVLQALDEPSARKLRVSFVVYESSVMFSLNSSMIERVNKCEGLPSDQIVSNVVSVTTNHVIGTNGEDFVTTTFQTSPVSKTWEKKQRERKLYFWYRFKIDIYDRYT